VLERTRAVRPVHWNQNVHAIKSTLRHLTVSRQGTLYAANSFCYNSVQMCNAYCNTAAWHLNADTLPLSPLFCPHRHIAIFSSSPFCISPSPPITSYASFFLTFHIHPPVTYAIQYPFSSPFHPLLLEAPPLPSPTLS
jgi:hypothetical protein